MGNGLRAPGADWAGREADGRAELERVLTSAAFANSQRLCQFLRFIVEEAIRDGSQAPKELSIAAEVYGRPEYDPRTDTIVRVDAGRLRKKLAAYYAAEGRGNPARIELPRGSYRPILILTAETESPSSTALPRRTRRRWAAAAAVAVLTAATAYWMWPAGSGHVAAVALFPIANRSGDARLDQMAESMARNIEAEAGRLPGVSVIGLSDPAERRRAGEDLGTVLRRLRGSAVVEGALSVRGGQVRASFRAIDADRGFTVWTETFEAPAAGLVRAQQSIERAFVESLRRRLRQPAPHPRELSANSQAVRDYMSARYLRLADTEEALAEAVDLLRATVAADPGFSAAWSLLADSLQRLADVRNDDDPERYHEAIAAARSAIEIDRHDMLAHMSLGSVLLYHAWDFAAAEAVFRRAAAIEPENDDARRHLSDALMLQRKFDEALAVTREPAGGHSFRNLYLDTQRILVLQAAGRTAEALEQARQLTADAPDFRLGFWLVGNQLRAMGQLEAACEQYEKCLELAGGRDRRCSTALAHVEARLGRPERAAAELQELESANRAGNTSFAAVIAMIHCGLGDTGAALEWLERSAQRREANFAFVHIEPQLAALRGEERFERLIALLGNP